MSRDYGELLQNARAMAANGQGGQAALALKEAIAADLQNPQLHGALGQLLLAAGQTARAMRHLGHAGMLEKVLEDSRQRLDATGDADQRRRFANLLASLGRRDEAAREYCRALAQDPANLHALCGLSALNLPGPAGPAGPEIARLLQRGALSPQEQGHALFALGQAADRAGDFPAAWGFFSRANLLAGQAAVYKPEARRLAGQKIRRAFGTALVAQKQLEPELGRGIIFIVGMPRSGTSLVEEILASHRAVHGGGELPFLNDMPRVLAQQTGRPYPECVAEMQPELARLLAAGYLAEAAVAGAGAGFITDKLPINHQHLGLAAMLLPGAKIVHLTRHPLDVCLSNFFQPFDPVNQPASYSLENLAVYHGIYSRLMRHWRAVLPMPFLEVRYETLVAEPLAQAKRLLAFCGLEWDPGVLDFQQNQRLVTTASWSQVRENLHGKSVARWRNYQDRLDGLKEALKREEV